MTCDSFSLFSATRKVWIILQRGLSLQRSPWSDQIEGWSTAACTELSHALLLAPSPSCWFSSICLLSPSPKKASIKFLPKMRMGHDSYKLEQTNVLLNPTPHPGLSFPRLFLSVSYRQQEKLWALLWGREQFLFTDAHYTDVSWFHQATLLDAVFLCLPSYLSVFSC